MFSSSENPSVGADILRRPLHTYRYVDHVLEVEREKMKCCSIMYGEPKQSSQNFIYAGILLAGFVVYFAVIFFSSPVR